MKTRLRKHNRNYQTFIGTLYHLLSLMTVFKTIYASNVGYKNFSTDDFQRYELPFKLVAKSRKQYKLVNTDGYM